MIDSLWIALGLTGFLIVPTFFAPLIRKLPFIPERYTASFAGGFAVAFVFLELLPGIAENKETIGALLASSFPVTPLMDLTVYVVGLLGFMLFFGLEKLAHRRKRLGISSQKSDFYIHLSALGLENGLMTYALPVSVEAGGVAYAAFFTVVMGLQFLIVDRTLERHYTAHFDHLGRFALMLCLCLGWFLAYLTEPDNIFIVALLTAFVGGSILMNIFKEEIPDSTHSSFPWFSLGVGFGTAILFVITFLRNHQ